MTYLEYNYDKFIFKVKENLYYHEEGYWVEIEKDIGKVGITDFLQTLNGDIASVELFGKGRVKQGEVMGDIETMKVSLELYCPVSGEIIEKNKELVTKPELVNLDPYGEGWLLKIKLKNFEVDRLKLISSVEYLEFMKKRVKEESGRLKSDE